MERRGQAVGVALVLLSTLGFGAVPTLTRLAFDAGINVPTALALRFGATALLAWPFLLIRRQGGLPRRRVAGLALTGLVFAANSSTFFLAVRLAPAASVAVIFYCYPAIVVLLSMVFLGERLTPIRAGALALAMTGCLLTLGVSLSGADARGMALSLLSAALYAVYIVLSSRFARDLPVTVASTWIISAVALTFLGYALVSHSLDLGFPVRGWVVMASMVLLATVVAVYAFLGGVLRLGPSGAAIVGTVEPVVAVGLAAAILGDRLGPAQLVGGLAILAAVLALRLPGANPAPLPSPAPSSD
ncbi:MAG TPA: DMT family transporter [Thermomicrobiaceae bacterium]|nr:DMT family transporter [Thermomicrobiaceae bacterium]